MSDSDESETDTVTIEVELDEARSLMHQRVSEVAPETLEGFIIDQIRGAVEHAYDNREELAAAQQKVAESDE